MDSAALAQFEADGWLLIANVLSLQVCDHLTSAIGNLDDTKRNGGKRNLLTNSAVVNFLRSSPVQDIIKPLMGNNAFAVRATLFNKVESANWQVPWHRDRLVAVRRRLDVPGFSAWSVKGGINHAEPPLAVLERLIAVRFHLDDSSVANGPLRVLSGSHKMREDDPIDAARVITIAASRGSALIMRPLLRHSSRPALLPRHRRILHVEFAAEDLPGGLEWIERI